METQLNGRKIGVEPSGKKRDLKRFEKSGSRTIGAADTTAEQKKQILVVDDDCCIRHIVNRMLSMMGFDVTEARDGMEAFNLFLEHYFDMVITDFNMPIMDGLTLSRHIKENSPSTPTVLMTAEDRGYIIEKTRESKVDYIISKPFRFEDIEKTVRKILGQEKSVPADENNRIGMAA